ncbi:MAG: zinc metallopeptidase [Gammaproteobacteria bacterium]
MHYVLITGVLIFLVYFPTLWVRFVMRRHSKEISDMPGTGGELAEHLLQRFDLSDFVVERTAEGGDHFDSSCKAVRLSPANYSGKSLTAVAVAAHEVGHALQYHNKERIFELRSRYIPLALVLKKAGILIVTAVPVVALVFKAPVVILLFVIVGAGLQLLGALSYLIVLPEEWDASFNKALPILTQGEYIHSNHVPAVRSVLKAAALTYFAGALADIVNLGRWLMVLRR